MLILYIFTELQQLTIRFNPNNVMQHINIIYVNTYHDQLIKNYLVIMADKLLWLCAMSACWLAGRMSYQNAFILAR